MTAPAETIATLQALDERAMNTVASRLAPHLTAGDIVALDGPLGAGKTVFARALINALPGDTEEVPSPTFTLVQTYNRGAVELWHFDMYRLDVPEEAFELGIEDAFVDAVSLIEWPEKMGRLLPKHALIVNILLADASSKRDIQLIGGDNWAGAAQDHGLEHLVTRRANAAKDFLGDSGWAGARQIPLAADASFRTYQRIELKDRAAVLMDAPPPEEDVRPFARIARYLIQLGFSAPRILAEDPRLGFLLLEDLGDDTYTRVLNDGGDEEMLYALAVDVLIRLHQLASADTVPPETPSYDLDALMAEAILFIDWYMPAVTAEPVSDTARESFDMVWRSAFSDVANSRETLVLRDYHVDNMMWLPQRPSTARCGLLDFQDALIGARAYDLMSLLEDARRDVSSGLYDRMLTRYVDGVDGTDINNLKREIAVLGAGRHAKVIGIFTRLSRRDGKHQYLPHIDRVWRLLEHSLRHPALNDVAAWFSAHVPAEKRFIPAPDHAEA